MTHPCCVCGGLAGVLTVSGCAHCGGGLLQPSDILGSKEIPTLAETENCKGVGWEKVADFSQGAVSARTPLQMQIEDAVVPPIGPGDTVWLCTGFSLFSPPPTPRRGSIFS